MSSGVSDIGSQEHRDSDGSRRGGAVTVTFGSLLARLRRAAGLTQMDLALTAGVSTRHANFLERGRSQPSRTMVDRFCSALRVDERTRDRLLLAAGFAPASRADNARPADPDLRESFAMALAIRRQPTIASVLRLGSASLRELGLEDVLCDDRAPVSVFDSLHVESDEATARRLAQRIICDSVHETLQRLSDCSSAVREPLPDR